MRFRFGIVVPPHEDCATLTFRQRPSLTCIKAVHRKAHALTALNTGERIVKGRCEAMPERGPAGAADPSSWTQPLVLAADPPARTQARSDTGHVKHVWNRTTRTTPDRRIGPSGHRPLFRLDTNQLLARPRLGTTPRRGQGRPRPKLPVLGALDIPNPAQGPVRSKARQRLVENGMDS